MLDERNIAQLHYMMWVLLHECGNVFDTFPLATTDYQICSILLPKIALMYSFESGC